ncbi:hypothetical protein NTGBS_970009 [Candidatus Nitrotoga sp. BS]|nr:hypothetical protein NTGBS_970009 [Candidatus Nitrotoga sp. BS]
MSVRLLQLMQMLFPNELVNLIIDDTLVPRYAKTGPGISIKHDHSHKANLPTEPESYAVGRGANTVGVSMRPCWIHYRRRRGC